MAIDISQLFASSYVTSLSLLSQAQKRSTHVTMTRLKPLAVSHPNTSDIPALPQSILEVKKLVDAAHLAAVNSGGSIEPNILHLNGVDVMITCILSVWIHSPGSILPATDLSIQPLT